MTSLLAILYAIAFWIIGFAQAKATATVDVQKDVEIEAGDAAAVTSSGEATAKIETQTKQELGDSGFAASLAWSQSTISKIAWRRDVSGR